MRQLPRPFRKRRMAAGPVPGVRRLVRPAGPGAHSLRSEKRRNGGGKVSLRHAGRNDRQCRPISPAGCTWRPSGWSIRPIRVLPARSSTGCGSAISGLGLFEPADDFRLDTPASHPELLDWLAYDFVEHGCDLKHTIRLILTSRTYQLRYDPKLEDHFTRRSQAASRAISARRPCGASRPNSFSTAPRDRPPASLYRPSARFSTLVRPRSPGPWAARPRATKSAPPARRHRRGAVARVAQRPRAARNDLCRTPVFADSGKKQDRAAAGRSAVSRRAEPPRHHRREERWAAPTSNPPSRTDEGLKDMLWAIVCGPEFQYIK